MYSLENVSLINSLLTLYIKSIPSVNRRIFSLFLALVIVFDNVDKNAQLMSSIQPTAQEMLAAFYGDNFDEVATSVSDDYKNEKLNNAAAANLYARYVSNNEREQKRLSAVRNSKSLKKANKQLGE